ncbi:MAG: sigma-54 dependent transcriptional regulator [Myxococcota bacterium]
MVNDNRATPVEQEEPRRILIADDEAALRTVLSALLRKEGFAVTAVSSGQEALDVLRHGQEDPEEEPFNVLIADLKMPGMDGMELLRRVIQKYAGLPVVMLTAHGTVDTAVQALKRGAFDFLTKPYERDEILMVLRKAISQSAKTQATTCPPQQGQAQEALIGNSPQMQRVRDLIRRVADTTATVLITGESGTGKELVAQALHESSSRAGKPFIRLNCAAIPQTLLEFELFGHEKGAFTGAVTEKPGRLELADGGTLLLDEIADLPVDLQAKLLHVLQEAVFERVGGIKTLRVDVRLIASTNQDLPAAIQRKEFREDLYYRLNVVPIDLPPLRQRLSDVPALVTHFMHKYNTRLSKHVRAFTEEAVQQLQKHAWPGNIRELENVVERTLLFTDTDHIHPQDLPADIMAQIQASSDLAAQPDQLVGAGMKDIVRQRTAQLESAIISAALKQTGRNVTRAAQKLKISRKSLQLKMRDLGLRESSGQEEEMPT